MAKGLLPALRGLVKTLVDDDVAPKVYNEGGVRCLRFRPGVVQSAMRVSNPFALDLSYTQAMMGFLLFNAAPRDILIIGLGGGSLPKFCYRELSQARVTTVEIDPAVIALRDEFLIPADNERFRIVQADGCDYLERSDLQADVIMVDGYDAVGLPDSLCSESFYSNCWNALSSNGVLVVNLWGGARNRTAYIDRLRSIFDDRVWWSRPRESSGLIVYAVKDRHYYPKWTRLMSQAHALDARYRLELTQVVSDMRERPEVDE